MTAVQIIKQNYYEIISSIIVVVRLVIFLQPDERIYMFRIYLYAYVYIYIYREREREQLI